MPKHMPTPEEHAANQKAALREQKIAEAKAAPPALGLTGIAYTPPSKAELVAARMRARERLAREAEWPTQSSDGAHESAPGDGGDHSPSVALSTAAEVEIPIDQIDVSPFQPRIHIDEKAITEMGMSLASEGQINAIIVRPIKGRYELIGGERRWRAAQSIGKTTIRAVVRQLSDDETALMALVDNVAREDLTDFERALLVTAAITKIFDGKLDVLNALNWLKAEHRARYAPTTPAATREYRVAGRMLGEMRVDGRKLVITCAPGVTPDELMNTILLSKPESLSNG